MNAGISVHGFSAAWTSDSKLVAVAFQVPGMVIIWDYEKRELLKTLRPIGPEDRWSRFLQPLKFYNFFAIIPNA